MRVSIHQPAYLPWLGYFERILKSDVFVFLDCVQFEKNSFTNRNKIKTPQGALWLSVPVKMKNHTAQTLAQTRIDNANAWQKKHLNAIFYNYKKAEFFDEIYALIEPFYAQKYELLSDFAFEYLKVWCEHFGIKTPIFRASQLNLNAKKSDLVLEICEKFGATCYFSGALGENYLQKEKFAQKDIKIEFQNYTPKPYPQLFGDFVGYLGCVDFAMNNKGVLF